MHDDGKLTQNLSTADTDTYRLYVHGKRNIYDQRGSTHHRRCPGHLWLCPCLSLEHFLKWPPLTVVFVCRSSSSSTCSRTRMSVMMNQPTFTLESHAQVHASHLSTGSGPLQRVQFCCLYVKCSFYTCASNVLTGETRQVTCNTPVRSAPTTRCSFTADTDKLRLVRQ